MGKLAQTSVGVAHLCTALTANAKIKIRKSYNLACCTRVEERATFGMGALLRLLLAVEADAFGLEDAEDAAEDFVGVAADYLVQGFAADCRVVGKVLLQLQA